MKKERLDENEIMEYARQSQGIERLDQIKYAVLERNGAISTIPKRRGLIGPGCRGFYKRLIGVGNERRVVSDRRGQRKIPWFVCYVLQRFAVILARAKHGKRTVW